MFMRFWKRNPVVKGGNTFILKDPVNMVDGQPAFNGIGTLIDWKSLGINPTETIKANCAKVAGRFVPTQDEPIALVAYGGSLNDTWEEIADFDTIFTCSGAHKFLLDRKIIPTYHVDSDPRPHKVGMLGEPHPEVTYMVASICDPNYLDFLVSKNIPKILLWHIFFMEQEILGNMPQREWMLTGGDVIGTRIMKMARLMGYTNMHCFGYDFSTDNPVISHAGQHPNPRHIKAMKSLKYKNKLYYTTEEWELHLQSMINDLDRMPEVSYRFYGHGLLQAMIANHVPVIRSRRPLGVETYAVN